MNPDRPTPRPPSTRDVAALIGVLAVIEGELLVGDRSGLPAWVEPIARRLSREGLIAPDADARQVRQGLNDLNQRLRFALGEYGERPAPSQVP